MMKLERGLALAIGTWLAATLGGCTNEGQTGQAQVRVTFALTPSDIDHVTVTVTGGSPDLSAPIVATLAKSGTSYTGAIADLPVGTGRLFQADAFHTDGSRLYTGQSTVAIASGATAQVSILAQEIGGGGQTTVWVPVIDSLTSTASTVAPSTSVSLAVAAHSPSTPPEPLTYQWSAVCSPSTGDHGTFANASAAAATWTAPGKVPTTCALSVVVRDGHLNAITASLVLVVQATGGSSDANVTVAANTWPVVTASSVNVQYDLPTGTPPVLGATSEADLTVTASDPDGDTLAFSWSDGACGGTFSTPGAATTHYSVADNKNCTLTVTIIDLCTSGDCAGISGLSDGSPRGGSVSMALQIHAKGPTTVTTPAPTGVTATLGTTDSSVIVSFTPPADSAALSYTVSSTPPGLSATGSTSPLTVACGGSCAGYAFAVSTINDSGPGTASASVDVITSFRVVETIREPMTAPYDSIFTGTFTLDSTTRTVSNLAGALTESMSPYRTGTLTTVPLTYQLADVSDGLGGNGRLVTTFNLNTVNTFDAPATPVPALFAAIDPSGHFAPGGTVFYGFASGATNPSSGGAGNAYATVAIDTDFPTGTATPAQVNLLAYADCKAGGMMSASCMTGTTVAAYGRVGTMSGSPLSQVVTRSSGAPVTLPGAPTGVTATLGTSSNTVVLSFTPPADSGGSPITGYVVSSKPKNLNLAGGSGTTSPITVTCPSACAGLAFRVSAINAAGAGMPSAPVNVITTLGVVTTFREPMTQPNDSIFTGTFTLDSTTRTVSNLQGSLTESMTMNGGVYAPPMTTVSLTQQLSVVADGLSTNGKLVTTFLLSTVDTFFPSAQGMSTFDPANTGDVYFGFPAKWNAAQANAYVMVDVNADDPYATPTQSVLDRLAYADCTAGGMMGAVCMTGTTETGYGHIGSMSGYPVSQVITKP